MFTVFTAFLAAAGILAVIILCVVLSVRKRERETQRILEQKRFYYAMRDLRRAGYRSL